MADRYRAIPETCGRCHSDVLQNGYLQSAHFQKLAAQGKEAIGPNCVTCHGSMNTYVLNVTTVIESCAQCHNAETGSLPDVPQEARTILSRFLSIHRFYRYVGIREDPLEAARFFKLVDPEIQEVIAAWHALDFPEVKRKMVVVLELMKRKRDEIRSRSDLSAFWEEARAVNPEVWPVRPEPAPRPEPNIIRVSGTRSGCLNCLSAQEDEREILKELGYLE